MINLKYGIFFGLILWMALIIVGFNYAIILGILATISPLLVMAYLAN